MAQGRLSGPTSSNKQRLSGAYSSGSVYAGNQTPYYNETPSTYTTTSSGYSYSGGGYGGGGYGGGSGSSEGPTKEQVNAAKSLGPIAAYGNQTLLDKAGDAANIYNMQDEASGRSRDMQVTNAMIMSANEWFPRLLKEQRVAKANRDKMGNTAYGSGYLSYLTDLQRIEDADAVDVLDTLYSNLANIDQEYFDALQQSRNGYNEFAMDTEARLREGAADYAAQLANIHPDLATGEYKGTSENGDEGETWPEVIDVESRKLNIPDWLTTSFYDKNKKEPVEYTLRDLFRPNAAIQKVNKNEYYNRDEMQRTSGAANENYWKSMNKSYGYRRV